MHFDEVLFLDVDDVLYAHDLAIARFGGADRAAVTQSARPSAARNRTDTRVNALC
jgi:hypothetical protein